MQNILVIGSGGIGIEILKNLYLLKHKNLTLIDFDTISISNLNRQFFFKNKNVNDYKSKIAAQIYKNKCKNSNIKYHISKIEEFDLNFLKKFDIVYNCLDNNEARSYVNKRCLLANIVLIDGGSTGFLGQAQYFSRHSCFDCLETEPKKEYPVCSIRTIPEKYEHCVIWAKSIFFEEYVCGKVNTEYNESKDNDNEDESVNNVCIKYDEVEDHMSEDVLTNKDEKTIANEAKTDCISGTENSYANQKGENLMKIANNEQNTIQANRKTVIKDVEVNKGADIKRDEFTGYKNNQNNKIFVTHPIADNIEPFVKRVKPDSQYNISHLTSLICKKNYSLTQDDKKLLRSITSRIQLIHENGINKKEFDKDNDIIMDLLHNVAVLRSVSFGITPKPRIETENIAGNIVAAVSSTNAIVASLMICIANKLLITKRHKPQISRSTEKKTCTIYNYFLTRKNNIQKVRVTSMNADCKTCKSMFFVFSKKPNTKLKTFLILVKSTIDEKFSMLTDTGLYYDSSFTDNVDRPIDIKNNEFFYLIGKSGKRYVFYVRDGKFDKIIKM